MTEINEMLDGMKPVKASMHMEDDDMLYVFEDEYDGLITLRARAKNNTIERAEYKGGGKIVSVHVFGPFEDEEFADTLDELTDMVEGLEVQDAD